MSNQKPFSAPAERNRTAISDALNKELIPSEHVFEFGSGTGQHACHIAANHPNITWQPSDLPDKIAGIEQWIAESGCTNILPPVTMDLAEELPKDQTATLCYTANTLHIVSWGTGPTVLRARSILIRKESKTVRLRPVHL